LGSRDPAYLTLSKIGNEFSIFVLENEKEEVIENIIDALGDASENDLQKLLVEINSFINNTRLWKLKGYTLNELNSKYNNTFIPNIGRNDTCICGSGKNIKSVVDLRLFSYLLGNCDLEKLSIYYIVLFQYKSNKIQIFLQKG